MPNDEASNGCTMQPRVTQLGRLHMHLHTNGWTYTDIHLLQISQIARRARPFPSAATHRAGSRRKMFRTRRSAYENNASVPGLIYTDTAAWDRSLSLDLVPYSTPSVPYTSTA